MSCKALVTILLVLMYLFGPSTAKAQSYASSSKELHSKLKLPISIDQKLVTLKEFKHEWEKRSGIELVLDEAALAEEGITLDTLVSVHLVGVSAESVLKIALRPLGFTFYPSEGKLIATSIRWVMRDSWGMIETKIYPIGDLIVDKPDASVDSERSIKNGVTGSYLESLVLNSFEEFSWKEFGGSGTVKFHAASQTLIIRQYEKIHDEINEFLATIRSTMNQEVRVDLQLVDLQGRIPLDILKLNGRTITKEDLATLLRKSDPQQRPNSGYQLEKLPLTLQNGKVAKFKHKYEETKIAAVLIPDTNQVKLTVSSQPQLGVIEDFGFTQTVIANFEEPCLFVISQPYFSMPRTLYLTPRLLLITPKKHSPDISQ